MRCCESALEPRGSAVFRLPPQVVRVLAMTFVVARTTSTGGVRVVADLRITRDDNRRGYPVAALKNVILGPDLLVAYAGNAQLATHTIRELAQTCADREGVISRLSGQAANEAHRVEYLVAAPNEGLWRVRATSLEGDLAATWIGDQDAFELYQRAYHELHVAEPLRVPGISPEGPLPIPTEDLEALMRMSNGIRHLESEGSVETVGEAFIAAYASPEGFRYEPQAFLAADHEQVIAGDEWVPADWGTVATGGFGYATLAPTNPGIGLLGLYFPHAGLGLLYHPLVRDKPFVYPRLTHAEFRARVLTDHGVDVDGPRFG